MPPNAIRRLRIELGQTQEDVTQRALKSHLVRSTFSRTMVAKIEAPKPEGWRSHDVRVAVAIGLGLTVEDLDTYLTGGRTLAETVTRSSVAPDPKVVAKLRATEARRGAKAGAIANAEGAGEEMTNLAIALRVGQRGKLPAAFLREFEQRARADGEHRPIFELVDEMRAQASAWIRLHESSGGHSPSTAGRSPRKVQNGQPT